MINMIKFPAIVFSKPSIIELVYGQEELTTCNKLALKNGYFSHLQIIDSSGMRYLVEGAEKIGTVGNFWGYNIFLNQKIRVKLVFKGVGETVSLEEVKEMVLVSFKEWGGWSAREDFDDLKKELKNAGTLAQLISLFNR